MADRSISTDIWPDMEDWPQLEKFTFLYLSTCHRSNVCGLFKISYSEIAFNLCCEIEQVKQALVGLTEKGWLICDGNVVFLPKYGKRQKAEKLTYFPNHVNKVCKDIARKGNKAGDAFVKQYKNILESDSLEAFNKAPTSIQQATITMAMTITDKIEEEENLSVKVFEAAPETPEQPDEPPDPLTWDYVLGVWRKVNARFGSVNQYDEGRVRSMPIALTTKLEAIKHYGDHGKKANVARILDYAKGHRERATPNFTGGSALNQRATASLPPIANPR